MASKKKPARPTFAKVPTYKGAAHGTGDFLSWSTPCFIAVATFLVFVPVLRNGFVDWDDPANLINNPHYRGLGWSQLVWMFTTFHESNYRPLTWVTLGLDYLLWGMNPFGYHLTSLLLHVINAILFYFLAYRLLCLARRDFDTRTEFPLQVAAGFSALIFAIHPLRVESVAWVSARNDVVSALFYIWTILCYLSGAAVGNRFRLWRMAGAVVVYSFSLFSKGIGLTLPVVLVVLDIYPLKRLGPSAGNWFGPEARRIWWEKVPFLIVALAVGLTAVLAKQEAAAMYTIASYGLVPRFAQVMYGIMFYLWKSLIPLGLSPLYELPFDFDAWIPVFLLCGVVVISISLVLYRYRRRWPALLACWMYYLIVVGPVLGLVQSGPQLVADRYSYLSCLSWALLAGGVLFSWRFVFPHAHRGLAFVALAAVVMIVAIWSHMTWIQTGIWRNSKTLWEHVVAVAPDSSIGRFSLGRFYEQEGRLEQAMESYRRALTINPTLADAHYNLARLLAKQDMRAEAIEHYRRVLMLKPEAADAHNNLGLLLALQGEVQAALEEFQKAMQIDPRYAKAFFNMGRVLSRQGNFETAVHYFQEALKLAPNQAEIHLGLGDALARQGKAEQAIIHFQDAIRLQPDLVEAHVAVARLLAAQGKKDEAEKHYLQGLQILKSRAQSSQ